MAREVRMSALIRRQWGVISRAQLGALGAERGWIRRRIARGMWAEVLPGVLQLASAPDTWFAKAHAALLWSGEQSALAGRSAAFVHGWIPKAPVQVEVVVADFRRLRHPEVRVRRSGGLTSKDFTSRQGLRVTIAPRTLIELADDRDLEPLLDTAIQQSPRVLRWLHARLSLLRPGHRGISRLRKLLADRSPRDPRWDSALERDLWRLLKRAKLHPVHHLDIVDRQARLILQADFAWPVERVVVETDGYRHHGGRKAFLARADVEQRLAALGWTLIPVTWNDVAKRPREVVQRILAALRIGAERAKALHHLSV